MEIVLLRRIATLVLTALAVAGAPVSAYAGATPPAATADLGLTTFADMVVDDAHGHVFVSGDDSVVVRDLDGAAVTTIGGQTGARGMALSPDSTVVYVALRDADAISVIDTVTLVETARFPTTGAICPGTVAATATHVWFGYGCTRSSGSTFLANGDVGVVDLVATPPAVTTGLLPTDVMAPYDIPGVHVRAADPARLVVADYYRDRVWLLAVDGGALTTVALRELTTFDGVRAVDLGPDATEVVVGGPTDKAFERYRIDDLAPVGQYVVPEYVTVVALSPEGVVASLVDGGVRTSASDGTPLREFAADRYVTGLAFGGGDSRLFAVSDNSWTNATLRVLRDPVAAATKLSLTVPAVNVRTPFTVSGTLSWWPATVPTGTTIHVTRSNPDGSVTARDVVTDETGAYTFDDTVPVDGAYTYTVTNDGDEHRDPVREESTVTATKYVTGMVAVTPGWTKVGQTFEVGGELDWPDAHGLDDYETWPAADVDVTRVGPDGTVTRTFEVRTAQGFFFYETLAVKGEYVYTFTFAGDAFRTAVTTTRTTLAKPYPSGFLELTPPADALADTEFAVTGLLNWPSAVVHVTRTAGTETVALDDVVTGADGRFTITDTRAAAGEYEYTVAYDGTDQRDPTTRSTTVTVGRQPTSLAVDWSPPATVGTPYTMTGTLSWPSSVVHVLRQDTSGVTELPDVVTDATGAFTVTDTPRLAGGLYYHFEYDGTDGREPASALAYPDAVKGSSALSVTAPPAATAGAGHVVTGTLDPPIEGATLHVERVTDTASVVLPDVPVATDGTFTITDTPLRSGRHTYVVTWAGDANYGGTTRSVSFAVAARASSLSLTAPSTATVGTSHAVTGVLDPAAATTAHVARVTSAETVPLADVAVATDGTFTITDTPVRSGRHTYVVTWDGDTAYGAATAELSFEVAARTSALALTAPATATVGSSHAVTGMLDPAAAATAHVTRVTSAGTVNLPDVPVAANGTFAVTDTPDRAGTHTYVVTWDGDPTYETARAEVSFPVTARTPSLTLTTNASSYAYGGVATVTATLGPTTTNRVVRIYARPYGQPAVLVREDVVNAAGILTATYAPRTNTTFTVTYAGDEGDEAATAERSVRTSVRLAQRLDGRYGTSGSYALFRRWVDPALAQSVAPNHAGGCMTYEAQIYSSGAWRTVQRHTCVRLDRYSRANVRMTATPRVGYRYRVRATFNGDSRNTKTYGSWLYLKFT